MMGISKRELLEDYYLDELAVLTDEWSVLHGTDDRVEDVEVSPEEFVKGWC